MRDAAVVDRAADARDQAADDRRVDAASTASPCGRSRCARPRSIASARSAASGAAVVTSARTTCAVVEQPLAVGRQQIRQQHEAIALGEQREQLRQDRRELRAAPSRSATAARLRGTGTAGFSSTFSSGGCCVNRSANCGELALDLREVGLLLDGDVEEGAGVADGGGFVGHECSSRRSSACRLRCRSLRRVSQAAQIYTIQRQFATRSSSRPHHDLHRSAPIRRADATAAGTPAARSAALDLRPPLRRSPQSAGRLRFAGRTAATRRSASTPGSTVTLAAKCSWFDAMPPDRFWPAIARTPANSGTAPAVDRRP